MKNVCIYRDVCLGYKLLFEEDLKEISKLMLTHDNILMITNLRLQQQHWRIKKPMEICFRKDLTVINVQVIGV